MVVIQLLATMHYSVKVYSCLEAKVSSRPGLQKMSSYNGVFRGEH